MDHIGINYPESRKVTTKKDTPIILKYSEDVRNIVVQVDLKKNTTTVFSGFSPWDNLALLLEALGATAQRCIRDGSNILPSTLRQAQGSVQVITLE